MNNIMSKLREAKEVKGMSYQDIADITELNGEAVSVSSVKRVFARDSDFNSFRYNQTMRPIIRAVLGLDEATQAPTDDPNQPEEYYTMIEAMKSVIDFKHNQIMAYIKEVEALKAEMRAMAAAHQKEIEELEEETRLAIAHLKDQIAYLRSVNDHNAKENEEKSQIIKTLLAK